MQEVDLTDEGSKQLLRLVEINAYALYRMVLCGNQNANQKQMYERMTAYAPGDLVLETSTVGYEDGDPRNDEFRTRSRVGILVEETREAMWERGADGDDPSEEIPTERVQYVRTFDGRVHRWHNASFIAIPNEFLWGRSL